MVNIATKSFWLSGQWAVIPYIPVAVATTEYGDLMLFGSPTILDEWGRRRIDSLLEDGTRIIAVVVIPVEYIIANQFPMIYLIKPETAKELLSKVENVTVKHVAKDFPEYLIKAGKASELRSKWS